jgi:hypothetical protein
VAPIKEKQQKHDWRFVKDDYMTLTEWTVAFSLSLMMK